jgi:hypothetical protein
MAIRLDTLPTDPTLLTEMVLALNAEQLRAVVVQTLILTRQLSRAKGDCQPSTTDSRRRSATCCFPPQGL